MKRSYLLTIKGVFLKDLTTTASAPTHKQQQPTVLPYTEIPHEFINVEQWPTTTNLQCWFCDRCVKEYPRFVPTQLNYATKHCITLGCFDRWGCVVGWINHFMPVNQRWDLLRATSEMESQFTGKYREMIPETPSKTLQAKYSGNTGMTPAQYDAACEEADTCGF